MFRSVDISWAVAFGLKNIMQKLSFLHLFFMLPVIHLVFDSLLYNDKLQVKFEFCSSSFNFSWDMALGVQQYYKCKNIFSPCLQIYIWYLAHWFNKESLKVKVEFCLFSWYFTVVWSLSLENQCKNLFSLPFSSWLEIYEKL